MSSIKTLDFLVVKRINYNLLINFNNWCLPSYQNDKHFTKSFRLTRILFHQSSRAAIGLGCIISSQGDLKQAESLFTQAYQQANNNEERALSQFNLFQVNKRLWWNQLDDNWQKVFKKAIKIDVEPTDSDLEKIVNLQELNCRKNQISNLELDKFKKAVPNCKVSS